MGLWLLMAWIFIIGCIVGALIRQLIYITKVDRIRKRIKKCK
jgi:uncharacterized membrane protein YciS (DUF1049 family)